MQKIVPHLWFDKEAQEAATFYTSIFPQSKIDAVTTLKNTPSGDANIVNFSLWDQDFMAISAGPLFVFNPSISFMVNFDPAQDADAKSRINEVWNKLVDGGTALMPIGNYPFSERYGWVQDKYGLSWQLILTNSAGEPRPFIIPSLMYAGDEVGKAEEAVDFYVSVFKHAKRGTVSKYPAGMEPDKQGTVMFSEFMIENQWLTAMDSARNHDAKFNEAISLLVNCDTQEEIDYYWEKLSADPKSEQCGWLKDKYGVSWQINPSFMNKAMTEGTQEQIDRITQAFMPMKKMDIATLKEAYEGNS